MESYREWKTKKVKETNRVLNDISTCPPEKSSKTHNRNNHCKELKEKSRHINQTTCNEVIATEK